MYRLGDQLPTLYGERFRTRLYNERVAAPGAWNKVVVVAREDEDTTMHDAQPRADEEPTPLPDIARLVASTPAG